MKKIVFFTLICCVLSAPLAFAQQADFSPSTPDLQLTEEQANIRIARLRREVEELEKKLETLNNQVGDVENELAETNAKLKDCNDEIYALVGATQADVDNFGQRLGRLEGRVREMKPLSDDALLARQDEVRAMEEELNGMRGEKISILPQFFDRIIALARDIRSLYREKKITTYTVRSWSEHQDCLWNIAGNSTIYSDPFLWPKIWQGNLDQIRNPDIIHPGQVLKVPPKGPKSSEELKAERRYYRNKRAQAEEQAGTVDKPTGAAND